MNVTPINRASSLSSRARAADIARLAGVSTATVDRVLNGRKGVKAATVQRVLRVATELDYLADDSRMALVSEKPMRVVFLLPAGDNQWLKLLGDYVGIVESQFSRFNVTCKRVLTEGFNPSELADSLLKLGEHADGIAVVALEHPLVREAVNRLVDNGKHVVTLASDLSSCGRAAYVGLDNRAAGRTAGLLLGRFIKERRGKIAMIAGSLSYRGHEEREMGFQHIQHEAFPHLDIVGVREGRDDSSRTYEQARVLLEQHPDLVGIYNIGGGSGGVGRALKEAKMDQRVVFIGHEITTDTRGLLMDGTMDAVIAQNPQTEVMNAIRIFANLRERKEPLHGIEAVRIGVYVRENLP